MTDKTNPNRWTAELCHHPEVKGFCNVKLYDGDLHAATVTFAMDKEGRAESLAEQINRSAPTWPAGWHTMACSFTRGNPATGAKTRPCDCGYEATAPTAPADDLPPGVERISDGTLWLLPDADLPEGWFISPRSTSKAMWPIERTPAKPATEWVPWWEALAQRMTVIPTVPAWEPFAVSAAAVHAGGIELWAYVNREKRWVWSNADGKVEVQR